MKKLIVGIIIMVILAGCSKQESNLEDYKKEYFEIVNNLTVDSNDTVGSLTKQHEKIKTLRIEMEGNVEGDMMEMVKYYESFCLGMIDYAKNNDEESNKKASEDYMKSLELWTKIKDE